jgi:transposase-like protein
VTDHSRSRCSACQNPRIAKIEAALAEGGTVRAVSRRFGLSRSSLSRHRAHSAPAPPADLGDLDAGDPGDRLNALYTFAQETLRQAQASGAGNLVVDAHSEVRLTLAALGRLHREGYRDPLPEQGRERLGFECRKAVTILGHASTPRDRIGPRATSAAS